MVAAVEVKSIKGAEWRDLGMPETLWNCRVKEFGPLVVSIGTQGRKLYAKELERLNVYLLEEPMATKDMKGNAELNRFTTIPVTGFETAYILHEFKQFIDQQVIDIAQPDAIWTGGLTECKKIADYADANHVKVVLHCFSSALCLASNLHLLASVRNGDMVEYDVTDNPLRNDILVQPFEVGRDGRMELSDRPGLGIQINWDEAQKYIVS